MGFLQKLFGKKEAAPVDSGYVASAAPPPLRTVYPTETPAETPEWKSNVSKGVVPDLYPVLLDGKDEVLKSGIGYKPLIGTAENPQLVVAFSTTKTVPFAFLQAAELAGYKVNDWMENALGNLDKEAVSIEKIPVENEYLLKAAVGDFTSEKLLSPAFMKEAHELFQSKELLVSVARRGHLLVAPRPASAEIQDAFLTHHDTLWQDETSGHSRLLNAALVMANGEIKGMIPLD